MPRSHSQSCLKSLLAKTSLDVVCAEVQNKGYLKDISK